MEEVALAKGFLTAYQELGVLGIFILLYIATVLFLIRTLVKDKEAEKNETTRVVTSLNAATNAMEKVSEGLDELQDVSEAQSKKVEDLLNYLRIRDQLRGGR